MRLIRLTQQSSGVTGDVRAALTSIGRGATVVGGVALLGVPAPEQRHRVDAVVIMPRGVFVVVGVDLTGPAIRLHAPLGEQWTADGWALPGGENTVNPAGEALESSGTVAARLRGCASTGEAARTSIGTVIAIGPYVETVEQPPEESAGTVRVLHPTTKSMLAAAVSLARAPESLRISQAREFIAAVAPSAEQPGDDALSAEGFVPDTATPTSPVEHLRTAASTVPADEPSGTATAARHAPRTVPTVPTTPTTPPPPDGPAPRPATHEERPTDPGQRPVPNAMSAPDRRPGPAPAAPSPRPGKQRGARWVPFGALALLGCLLVAAIVMAVTDAGRTEVVAASPTPSATSVAPPTRVNGIVFTARASASTSNCAARAFGEVRAELTESGCLRLRRASFTASLHGRTAAVTIAVLGFRSRQQARTFKELADTPGTGGIRDLAGQSGAWPGPRPRFARAAYASSIDGATVRLVRTDWMTGSSRSDDPTLVHLAETALRLPLPA